ncbi:MAG: hypothetical protein AB1757_07175 [Acidobacteriota bacterium]
MSSSTLELVLEKVKELTPEEQQKVRALLDSLNTEKTPEHNQQQTAPVTREEVQKILLAKGLIRQIPAKKPNPRFKDFKRLDITGKPLSEIIIEERR